MWSGPVFLDHPVFHFLLLVLCVFHDEREGCNVRCAPLSVNGASDVYTNVVILTDHFKAELSLGSTGFIYSRILSFELLQTVANVEQTKF